MKSKKWRLVLFILLTSILFLYLSKVLEADGARWRKGKFFARNTDSKVLLLGTSHMLYGVDPEVMDTYGVSGVYNLGGYAQRIPTSYWILVNALHYAKPEVVVLDVYCVDNDDKYPVESKDFLHTSIDAIPLSVDKIRMVNDLVEPEKRMEYLVDFYLYHNRWQELRIKDFEVLRYYRKNYHGLQNGCERDINVSKSIKPDIIDKDDYVTTDALGMQYLTKIKELCDKENIQLILVNIPYGISVEGQKTANGVGKYAKENNIPYYDMLRDDTLDINYETDFVDEGAAHLNVEGAKKVSEALARFIKLL